VLSTGSAQMNFDDDDERFLITTLDFVAAIIRGVEADDLILRGLNLINDRFSRMAR
jgi:hypothetical protein